MNSFTIAIRARTFWRRRRWVRQWQNGLGRTLPVMVLLVTINVRLGATVAAESGPPRNVMELNPSHSGHQDGTDRGHPYGGITSSSSTSGLSSSSSSSAGSAGSGSGGNADKPYFDDVNSRNVTTVVDDTAVVLKCRVKHKGDRTVSWMRKRDLHILTSDIYTYTGDQRFSVVHPQDSDDWDLKIEYPQLKDSGIYECQVNTEPKINLAVYLDVTEDRDFVQASGGNHFIGTTGLARAKITGSQEVHVKKGSTISLSCVVNVLASSISWYHGSAVVDFDSARGGISLETEKTEGGTSSRLMLTRATLRDSGNYTCVPSGAISASVQVHVLNGEHPAAMQTSSGVALCPSRYVLVFILATLNSCNFSKLISFISTLLCTERHHRRHRFVMASTAVSLLICFRRRCRVLPSSGSCCTNGSSTSTSGHKIRSLSISSGRNTEISSQSVDEAPTLLQKR